jgi:CheY-like chemotaxis protein
LEVEADRIRLAQVFANLLNNAGKYTERGGRIELTAERRRGEAMVSVRDTGIGISAENLPHVFEMFSQVAPAIERSQGGLGIGLSLVRGLVEMHDGRVEVHSDGLAAGSEFIVYLPLSEYAAIGEGSPPVNESGSAGSSRRRVMVVDDNRDAAQTMARVLQHFGHDVFMAHDGETAVAEAIMRRPDVVLLDIGLPKLNGYEVCRHIREQLQDEDMTIVALTGWGQDEDKRKAIEAGFDHHFTKPVDAANLKAILAT